MVRALLIEIKNWRTGERAYGINPRDPKLIALGGPLWQCLDYEPKGDWEIRLVLDDRPLKYKGKIILDDGSEVYYVTDIPKDAKIVDIDGVIVLNNTDEINLVLNHLPDKIYTYGFREAAERWAKKKGITLKTVEEEVKEESKKLIKEKKGYVKTAEKRKKSVEQVGFGVLSYAFLKKLHDLGCPYTYKAQIPHV